MRTYQIHFLCFALLVLAISSASAQKTLVTGKVLDGTTMQPLPYVNVFFKGSKIGTSSDENGFYRIETYYPTDSLVASFLGYGKLAKRVKADQSQVIDFIMQPTGIALGEITIEGDRREKDPAVEIMKKVVRNKKSNNREKLDSYEYSVYNKIEFDMNNIDSSFKDRRVMKPFQFVFDNIDSTSEDKPFLPIFLTESYSRYFYTRIPKNSREIIEATKVAGIKNESVSQFMGDMYQNTNIYANYVEAFGKNFVSPLSDFGTLSYKYFLLDSAWKDDKYWCYKIAFIPRRKGELVFEGEMWVHDTTYAIKEIEATVNEDANLNWVKGFRVHHVYSQVEDEVWMLVKEMVVADFNLTDQTMGFYGRKKTIYSDFVINEPKETEFFKTFIKVEVAEDANDKSDEYWAGKRPESLSENEAKVYEMVDTIQNIPAFRTYVDIIELFVTGYREMKYVDLGPYFTFISFNQIEGLRLRLGGRTNSDFSTRIEFNGYAAYGLKDNEIKYMGGSRIFLSTKPRQILDISHRRDLEQLGVSANAWRTDNILSSVFRRSPNNQLNAFEEYKLSYEIEYFPGVSNTLTFNRRDIWSVNSFVFQRPSADGSTEQFERISTAEARINTRIALGERFINGELDRYSLGTDNPILNVEAAFGIKGFLGGDYEYQRLTINVQDRIWFNPIGFSDVTLETGRIWGSVPFPLLNLFNGNETYFYDAYAFNLMNFYEFVGDKWVTFFWVHHFNGLLFNKIPLFRKLKWREVASVRGAIGGLSSNHVDELAFPNGLTSLNKPYFEVGTGIENILNIFRVDALWRLSYLNNPNAVPLGLRMTMQFEF